MVTNLNGSIYFKNTTRSSEKSQRCDLLFDTMQGLATSEETVVNYVNYTFTF